MPICPLLPKSDIQDLLYFLIILFQKSFYFVLFAPIPNFCSDFSVRPIKRNETFIFIFSYDLMTGVHFWCASHFPHRSNRGILAGKEMIQQLHSSKRATTAYSKRFITFEGNGELLPILALLRFDFVNYLYSASSFGVFECVESVMNISAVFFIVVPEKWQQR